MDHYERYPMMRPYVGTSYGSGNAPGLLLIGESHYLPEGATQHLSADSWYAGSAETLTGQEVEWISTAAILDWARSNHFKNKAHSIWKNAFKEINDRGPRFHDYRCVADHIAFYNFFLRPGRQGASLAVTHRDVEVANTAFEFHLEALKPSAIVFLSSLAYRYFRRPPGFAVPTISTPHPGCQWWNRTAGRYRNRRGRDLLGDFVETLNWVNAIDAVG